MSSLEKKTSSIPSDRSHSREASKKQGGGNKGMWKTSKVLDVPSVDKDDPNFDSENEENCVLMSTSPPPVPSCLYRGLDFDYGPAALTNLTDFKKAIDSILNEYFVGGEMDEVRRYFDKRIF